MITSIIVINQYTVIIISIIRYLHLHGLINLVGYSKSCSIDQILLPHDNGIRSVLLDEAVVLQELLEVLPFEIEDSSLRSPLSEDVIRKEY